MNLLRLSVVAAAMVCTGFQSTASVYARPEMIVTADWVAAHAADPDVRIVDLRPNGYAAGHIPGAVHLSNAAIRDPKNPPTFAPSVADFQALMSRLGISNRTRVVAYDERGGIYAARLWWILRYFGHANTALLDGGWVKWAKDGRPTSADAPQPAAAAFTARLDPRWLATAKDVLDAIGKPGVRIVDARTVGEIEGRDLRGIKRGGAIPSSIPVYWEDALDPDSRTFKSAADLRMLFESKGISPKDDVIVYCQVGMRASVDLFVLHLLGYDKLRNYYGAWEEWGNREDTPIKRG
jgi:thiosulfate/3-mercaptopyruvate sulfurtransferase